MTHELKILPEYFEAVATYKKNFEIRKNDRNFKVGDKLILKEWQPNDDQFVDPGYTGREVERWVSYILYDWQAGMKNGYCIMSLLRALPPVEPEIIKCKDCKHRGEEPIADGRYWCDIHDTFMYYCSDAERRTDEQFD